MRVRKKRNGERRLAACSYMLVKSPSEAFGGNASHDSAQDGIQKDVKDGTQDGTERPLCLEIGCGKGKFITETALRHPDCDFIAMELVTDVILLAMARAAAMPGGLPQNLRFINGNAAQITEIFEPNSVSTIFLNFSDPWPKARHAKRRLTYRSFLEQYKNILADGGELIIKTDNDGFFEFSVSELTENGWILDSLTHDLHGSPYAADNVMTEYETAFSARGKNINYVRARLK